MAANLVTISNVSKQTVPILVDSVVSTSAVAGSDLSSSTSGQLRIPPGEDLELEIARVDVAQLEQLQRLKLITFTQT